MLASQEVVHHATCLSSRWRGPPPSSLFIGLGHHSKEINAVFGPREVGLLSPQRIF